MATLPPFALGTTAQHFSLEVVQRHHPSVAIGVLHLQLVPSRPPEPAPPPIYHLYRSELQFGLRSVKGDVEHGQGTWFPYGTTAFQKAIETMIFCDAFPVLRFFDTIIWHLPALCRRAAQPLRAYTTTTASTQRHRFQL